MIINFKIIAAVIAIAIGAITFVPYIRDIFAKRTQPHIFTWLIWGVTQGTATAALWYGGGGLGALALTLGTILVFGVFFLSLRYGTKNIKKIDFVVLAFALLAIVVWWQTKNALLAVIMVSIIDFLGYLPSFRKTFAEPWSETVILWLGSMAVNLFSLIALETYNAVTVTYLITIFAANTILALICLLRRPFFPKPWAKAS